MDPLQEVAARPPEKNTHERKWASVPATCAASELRAVRGVDGDDAASPTERYPTGGSLLVGEAALHTNMSPLRVSLEIPRERSTWEVMAAQ